MGELRAMPVQKRDVMRHLADLLQARLVTCDEAIASTRAALVGETKSSAGDKYEVGRAMVQQELDKLEAQRAKLIQQQHELKHLPVERNSERIGSGSLVITDAGNYLIGIGVGSVELNGEVCYAVSLASPLGQALRGYQAGMRVQFQDRQLNVLEVR